MMYEIELKAHVDNPVALRELLRSRCVFRKSFDKYDTYYTYPEAGRASNDGARKSLRVRLDGTVCTVTIKEKHREGGIESNLEREFEVSSMDYFTWFLKDLGCAPRIAKHKRGELYALGEVNLELSEVEGLGWFLEVERLVSETDSAAQETARRQIREVLHSLGISEKLIEPRYYTDMLSEARRGNGEPGHP